jgi:hypothetical protein
MKLKDLLECFPHEVIELHSAYDGKLVAATKNSLEKFGEVTVFHAYTKLKFGVDKTSVHPFIYVFGSHHEIQEIKEGGKDDGQAD